MHDLKNQVCFELSGWRLPRSVDSSNSALQEIEPQSTTFSPTTSDSALTTNSDIYFIDISTLPTITSSENVEELSTTESTKNSQGSDTTTETVPVSTTEFSDTSDYPSSTGNVVLETEQSLNTELNSDVKDISESSTTIAPFLITTIANILSSSMTITDGFPLFTTGMPSSEIQPDSTTDSENGDPVTTSFQNLPTTVDQILSSESLTQNGTLEAQTDAPSTVVVTMDPDVPAMLPQPEVETTTQPTTSTSLTSPNSENAQNIPTEPLLLPVTTSIPSIEILTTTTKTPPSGTKVKTKSPSNIDPSFFKHGRPKRYPLFITLANKELTSNYEGGKSKNVFYFISIILLNGFSYSIANGMENVCRPVFDKLSIQIT